MDVSDVTRPAQAPTTQAQKPAYERCEQCGAPVEQTQRYCVVCGAHRRHVNDPAARYLASATSRTRVAAPSSRPRSAVTKRSSGLGTALVLAAIPLAIGLGVLVGHASDNGDERLIAALRSQKPEIITTGGDTSARAAAAGAAAAAAPAASTSTVSTVTSNFPLQSGYSIELQTLPSHGTNSAAVTSAEQAAEAKGAKNVGVILQSDFKITPAPPAGAYVIYSGAYGAKPEAEEALGKLRQNFPSAQVIQVQAAGTTVSPTANVNKAKVLSSTQYGTAHQVVGFHATPAQLAQGKQVVQREQQQQGKSYVDSQRGLPDQISVP